MLEPDDGLLLGTQVGDKYILNSDSAMVLEYMNRRLEEEDPTLRSYRRQLAFTQVVRTDLIPILLNCGDREDVFAIIIRLLVSLSKPMECLLSKEITQTRTGKQTIYELTRNVTMIKDAFLDTNVSRVILEHMSAYLVDKMKSMDAACIGIINNCLLLIRNILHVPDMMMRRYGGIGNGGGGTGGGEEGGRTLHNNIIWNLFRSNLDDVMLDCMSHINNGSWCVTIVQIIALIYKDQHVINLQKLLQTFIDSTLSESSDNESNTSPQVDQEESGSNPADGSDSLDSQGASVENNNLSSSAASGNGSTPSPPPSQEPQQGHHHMPVVVTATSFSQPVMSGGNGGGSGNVGHHSHHHHSVKVGGATVMGGGNNVVVSSPSQNSHITPSSSKAGNTSRNNAAIKESKESSDSLMEGEPPHKKYKEYWDMFHTEVGGNTTSSYSETDNMKPQTGGNQSGHTSESSDITGVPKTGKRAVNTASSSDIGYVSASQPCNQESTSSSSNDGDQRGKRTARTNPVKHKAKPETMSNEEKQEMRRRKMLSLARQTRMRVKAMVNYAPTDEDISEILKEFTIDFLLTEYSSLVRKLLETHQECKQYTMDKSHILWLITYFLKFATQLEIGLGHITSLLSIDTLTYVTYEGVDCLETLELAQRDRETELDPYLRRLRLVVVALREFMQTLATYKQSTLLSQADKKHLFNFQLQSTYIKGFRQLLILLLRSFNFNHFDIQHLTHLVVTNHHALKNMEEALQIQHNAAVPKLDIIDHIRQFANMELMIKYGQLLVNFQENSPQVNDSIFTIMHHVAGDLESPHTLFIPAVLQTFSQILEENFNICPDWVDLIEYIIQKFLHTMQHAPHKCAATITENMDSEEVVDECGLTPAEASSLFYNFNQVEHLSDPVGAVIDIYRQAGNISLTRVSLIQSLLAHGIITHAQYMNFMYMKSVLAQCNGEGKGSVKAEVGSEHCTSDGHITDSEDAQEGSQRENREIKVLKDCLVKQGRGSLITWIQEVLLDACRVKLYPTTVLPSASCVPHEPVAYYYNLTKQSIPLVPFSREQNLGLQTEAFILLLHKLGFLLPADVGKVYPRIPYFWAADHLYAVASKLGPLPEQNYRFTSDDIERIVRSKANDASGGVGGPAGPSSGGVVCEKKQLDDSCCYGAADNNTSTKMEEESSSIDGGYEDETATAAAAAAAAATMAAMPQQPPDEEMVDGSGVGRMKRSTAHLTPPKAAVVTAMTVPHTTATLPPSSAPAAPLVKELESMIVSSRSGDDILRSAAITTTFTTTVHNTMPHISRPTTLMSGGGGGMSSLPPSLTTAVPNACAATEQDEDMEVEPSGGLLTNIGSPVPGPSRLNPMASSSTMDEPALEQPLLAAQPNTMTSPTASTGPNSPVTAGGAAADNGGGGVEGGGGDFGDDMMMLTDAEYLDTLDLMDKKFSANRKARF